MPVEKFNKISSNSEIYSNKFYWQKSNLKERFYMGSYYMHL